MQFTPTQKRFAAWSLIAGLLVLVLWLLAPVLAPFVVAAGLAYALNPVVDWLDDVGRGRIPRLAAVVIVELVFLVALLGVLLLVVPILAKELPLMREQLPVLLDSLNTTLKPWLAQWGIHFSLDVASIKGFVMKYLNANVEDALGSVLASVKLGGSVAFAIVGNAILIPVALFYLLLDWARFVALIQELVPPRLRGGVDSFLQEADEVLGQYLRGQLLVMLILAVGYSVGLGLFGLDLALPIGVFTGLAIAVPYLGFGIGLVLATFAGLRVFQRRRGLPAGHGGGGLWSGAVGGKPVPHAAPGGGAYRLAPAGGDFCAAGLWSVAGFCGRADRPAGQCRAAGGDTPHAQGLPGQPPLFGITLWQCNRLPWTSACPQGRQWRTSSRGPMRPRSNTWNSG